MFLFAGRPSEDTLLSLLYEIQAAILDDKAPMGPVMLKLKFLASRLGSDILEDWVQHEAEGYPEGIVVPSYRETQAAYAGNFASMVSNLTEVPIPNYLIHKHAGARWSTLEIREGLFAIDSIIDGAEPGMQMSVDCGDLILLLQGKIYENYSCIAVKGIFGLHVYASIRAAVRTKVLDLTLELERSVPSAADIMVGFKRQTLAPVEVENVTKATHIIVHGNLNQVNNSGTSGPITVTSTQGDVSALLEGLTKSGLSKTHARELANIVYGATIWMRKCVNQDEKL